MRSSGVTRSVREKRCLSWPFLNNLTHLRNRALNFHYREVCFLCYRSPSTWLFLKLNSSCAGGFNLNFYVCVHEQKEKIRKCLSSDVKTLFHILHSVKPFFIFSQNVNLIFETSHGQHVLFP